MIRTTTTTNEMGGTSQMARRRRLNYPLTCNGFQLVLDLLLEREGDLSWCVDGERYRVFLQVDPHGSANHWL